MSLHDDLELSDRRRAPETVRDGLAAVRRLGGPCAFAACTAKSARAVSDRGRYRPLCAFHAGEIEIARRVAHQQAERRALRVRR